MLLTLIIWCLTYFKLNYVEVCELRSHNYITVNFVKWCILVNCSWVLIVLLFTPTPTSSSHPVLFLPPSHPLPSALGFWITPCCEAWLYLFTQLIRILNWLLLTCCCSVLFCSVVRILLNQYWACYFKSIKSSNAFFLLSIFCLFSLLFLFCLINVSHISQFTQLFAQYCILCEMNTYFSVSEFQSKLHIQNVQFSDNSCQIMLGLHYFWKISIILY